MDEKDEPKIHKTVEAQVEDIVKETNEGLLELVGVGNLPQNLFEEDQEGNILFVDQWDPCNNWAQLGFCIEYVENNTPLRFIIEASEAHHTYDLTDPAVENKRMLGFYELPEMTPTSRGKDGNFYNIAWSLYITWKKYLKEIELEINDSVSFDEKEEE